MGFSAYETRIASCPCGKGHLQATVNINGIFPCDFVNIEIQCDECCRYYQIEKDKDKITKCNIFYIRQLKHFGKRTKIDLNSFIKKTVELNENNICAIISEQNAQINTSEYLKYQKEILKNCPQYLLDEYYLLLYNETAQPSAKTENEISQLLMKIARLHQESQVEDIDRQVCGAKYYASPALFWAKKAVEKNYAPAFATEKKLVCIPAEDVKQNFLLAKALLLRGAELNDSNCYLEISEEYGYKYSKLFEFNVEKSKLYRRQALNILSKAKLNHNSSQDFTPKQEIAALLFNKSILAALNFIDDSNKLVFNEKQESSVLYITQLQYLHFAKLHIAEKWSNSLANTLISEACFFLKKYLIDNVGGVQAEYVEKLQNQLFFHLDEAFENNHRKISQDYLCSAADIFIDTIDFEDFDTELPIDAITLFEVNSLFTSWATYDLIPFLSEVMQQFF